MAPISAGVRASVCGFSSTPPMAPTMVTSSPSSIQLMPRAATSRAWNRLQRQAVQAGGNVCLDCREDVAHLWEVVSLDNESKDFLL